MTPSHPHGHSVELEHASSGCTGSWVPGPDPSNGYPEHWPQHWRCSDCRAAYYHSPEVMAAVEREHETGAILDVLSRSGCRD